MRWPTIPISEIAQQVRGVSYNKSQVSNNHSQGFIPILRAGNIHNGSLILDQDIVFVPEACVSSQQLLRPGDIVLAASSGSLDVVGKAAQIKNQWVGSFGAFCKVVRATSDRIDPRYLHHFFQSSGYRRRVSSLAAGANINNLKNEHIDTLEIPLPPLEEQRRIAAILDRASQIDALCDTAIDQHRALDESLFLHFFADLDSGRFSSLKYLSSKKSNSIRTGPFGSQLLHSEFTDSGVAVLGIDNAVKNEFSWAKNRFISQEKYEQLKRYSVNPGDVLITIMGTCGRVAVVPEDIPVAINTKHLCAISLDHSQVLPDYLHKFILYHPAAKRYLKQRTKGAIMGGLNMGIIKELPVLVPTLSSQLEWLHQNNTAQRIHQKALTAKAQSLSLKTSLANSFVEAANA